MITRALLIDPPLEREDTTEMLALDRSELDRDAAQLDAVVSRTSGIDQFCSSSAWVLSADRALMPARDLYCRRGDNGWIALARRRHERGWSSLESLEAAWCLASPFACDGDPADLAREFAEGCARDAPRDVLFLSGVQEGTPLFDGLIEALRGRYRFDATLVPPTRRFRASLEGGIDGFLARRSPTFRSNLLQADRKAMRLGIRFETVTIDDASKALAFYARMLVVEARSWKGLAGEGLAVPEMEAFYREMLPRLARSGSLRALVARHEESDVAFILGGVTDTPDGLTYRGLQFSFDNAHRSLSLGNLAQLAQITALSAEGVALYDLGSEVDYKRRWGEHCLETLTLVAIPRP